MMNEFQKKLYASFADAMTLEEIARKGCGDCSGCGQYCYFPHCLPPYLQKIRDEILAAKEQK